MKQVLFVGAGHHFPEGCFSFLRPANMQERVRTRGLFFKPVDYVPLASLVPPTGLVPNLDFAGRERDIVASHKAEFARRCENEYLPFDVEANEREWDKDLLIKESRFADLILISAEFFYEDSDGNQPNAYLRDALRAAECPVLVVPENFEKVEHLFMAYDGSRESMYAIKQFTYLFPHLTELPAELVYIREEESDDFPDIEKLRIFAQLKLDCMSFTKLHFRAEDFFSTWIVNKKNGLLVSGSFGRSSLSYKIRPGFAEKVIGQHALPVFIAHH